MDIEIGTQFIRRNTKRRDIETVVDIYTTKDFNGYIKRVTYLAEHDFLGQNLKEEIPGSTILRSEILTNHKIESV